MSTLRFPPLYLSVFLLQGVVLASVSHAVFQPASWHIRFLAILTAAGVALACGYSHARSSSRIFGVLGGTLTTIGLLMLLKGFITASASFTTYPALILLVGRNFTLTNRRNLYFDLSLLLAIFMMSLGEIRGAMVWWIGIPFITALASTIISDYIDQRLGQAQGGDVRLLSESLFDLPHLLFITASVLLATFLIYLVLPTFPSPNVQAFPSEFSPTRTKSSDPSWTDGAGKQVDSGLGPGGYLRSGATSTSDTRGQQQGPRFDLAADREILTGGSPKPTPQSSPSPNQATPKTGGKSKQPAPDATGGSGTGQPPSFDRGNPPSSAPQVNRKDASGSGQNAQNTPEPGPETKPGSQGAGGSGHDAPDPMRKPGMGGGHDRPEAGPQAQDQPAGTDGPGLIDSDTPRAPGSDESNHGGLQQPNGAPEQGGACSVKKPQQLLFHVAASRPLLLRTRVYEHFDGNFWESGNSPRHTFVRSDGNYILGDSRMTRTSQGIHVVADLDASIPAAYHPEFLNFALNQISIGNDATLLAPVMIGKGTAYYVESAIYYRAERPGGEVEALDNAGAYLDTRAMGDGLQELAKSLAAGARNEEEIAELLEQHFRQNFRSRETQGGTQSPSITHFLQVSHEGPASLFASAMTLLLRANGIPARFVTGYRVHRFNPMTNQFDVYNHDAHSWVEAYIDGRWMTYEPTPRATLPEKRPPSTSLQALQKYVDAAREDLQRQLESQPPDASQTQTLRIRLLLLLLGLLAWLIRYAPWMMLMFLLAALLLFSVPRLMRHFLDAIDLLLIWRKSQGDARQLILYIHEKMERACSRRKLGRHATLNHAEYSKQLGDALPHLARQFALLGQLFATARYGESTLAQTDGAAAFSAYREILELIDEQVVA